MPKHNACNEYKYKIEELFDQFDKETRQTVTHKITTSLNITYHTLRNWRLIRMDDTRDIPAEALEEIAHILSFFQITIASADDLKNYKTVSERKSAMA